MAPGVWPTTTEVRSHASLKGHTPLTFADGHMVARAELNNVSQVSHCRDLVQLPVGRCCMNTLWGWGRASWAGCGPDVRRGGQTLIMGYSADKSPLIGHLAGPLRRLEPLVAQRQEKCGPNRPTPTGYSCNNAGARRRGAPVRPGGQPGIALKTTPVI